MFFAGLLFSQVGLDGNFGEQYSAEHLTRGRDNRAKTVPTLI
jgi:hypothetical protein